MKIICSGLSQKIIWTIDNLVLQGFSENALEIVPEIVVQSIFTILWTTDYLKTFEPQTKKANSWKSGKECSMFGWGVVIYCVIRWWTHKRRAPV